MAMRWAAALVALSFLLAHSPGANASLPPITCDGNSSCTIVNCYREWADRKPCKVGQVVYPKTEAELVAAVAQAVQSGSKVKLVSKASHTFPKLACPAGDSGVLISTRDFNSLIAVDKEKLTVTVDAGVLLRDLVEALAEQELAFPYSPYWSELSVSGMLATGAHGSSFWDKGSAIHEYVTSVRVVLPASAAEGYAKVQTFTDADPKELAALKVHLGVLGAVSQVTFQVQPQFKRSVTFDVTSDLELEERLVEIGLEQEFGDVTWYPSQRQVRYRLDNRVPVETAGDGQVEGFPPIPEPNVEAFRAADLLTEATRNSPGQCDRAATGLQTSYDTAWGLANDRANPGVFTGYPVVGYNHHLQASSGCADGPADVANPTNSSNLLCLWDLGPKGGFIFQNAVALPVAKAIAFIRDVRSLVARRPYSLCDVEVYGGFTFRYIKGNSSAYLGKHEDVVDIDFTIKRATDAQTPIVNSDVHSEVEQIAVFKYGGSPHWGKSRPVTFTGIPAKWPQIKEFLKVKQALDPQRVFSNEWTDAVLGINGSVTEVKPFCALEGLCICSQHVHCAPEAGYFCRPGLVWKQARVCRFEGRKTKYTLKPFERHDAEQVATLDDQPAFIRMRTSRH